MIVTERQVQTALQYWGDLHKVSRGCPDKITLPKECSKLADLLGAMWWTHESEARLPDDHAVTALILQAFGLQTNVLSPGSRLDDLLAQTSESSSVAPAHNEFALGTPRQCAIDGDPSCEACQ
jgi:hypothetical protein